MGVDADEWGAGLRARRASANERRIMSWWCAFAFFASPPCSARLGDRLMPTAGITRRHHRHFVDICGIASHLADSATGSAFDAKTLWIETTTISQPHPCLASPLEIQWITPIWTIEPN